MQTAQLQPKIEHGLHAMRQDDYLAAMRQFTIFLRQIEPLTTKPHFHAARLEALAHLGTLQNRMGRRDEALASFEQYVGEARTARERAFGLSQLGLQTIRLDRLAAGLGLLEEALRQAESINYSHGRAHAFLGLGVGLLHYGRHEEALTQINTALSLFEQLADRPEIARAGNVRGIIFAQQGALDKAIQSFITASDHARELGRYDRAIILGNLGEAYQTLFDLEKALFTHRQALQLAAGTPIPTIGIDLRRNIGVTLCHLGKYEDGISYLESSLAEARRYQQGFLLGQIIVSLGLAECRRGNLTRAEEHGRMLLAQSEQHDQRARQAQALHLLGLCAGKRGDHETAEQQWQQALFLAHETGQQALLWQIHAALAKISTNTGLATTHWRIAWEVIEQIIYPIQDEKLRHTFLNAPAVREVRAHIQNQR